MKLSYLWHGLPGHPLHPPLTDATLGTYTFATVAAFAEVVGITENAGAYGWWIALIAGLIFTVPTALTGFADWLTIPWRSDLWWTATYHMLSMVTATIFFALAAIVGHGAYTHGNVSSGAFVLTLIGFGFLTLEAGSAARSSTSTGCACSTSSRNRPRERSPQSRMPRKSWRKAPDRLNQTTPQAGA
jgi:predicted membrane protein DUF2231